MHKLKPQVEEMVNDLCSKFLVVEHLKKGTPILQIDHTNPRLFVKLETIYVGVSTTETISELKKDPKVSPFELDKFFKSCLSF